MRNLLHSSYSTCRYNSKNTKNYTSHTNGPSKNIQKKNNKILSIRLTALNIAQNHLSHTSDNGND